MDGYRPRNPYYGMPQVQGGNFYNPNMQKPDISGGLHGILNMMRMMKQEQMAREQQEYQRGITERQLGMEQERIDIAKQPTPIKPTTKMQDVAFLIKQGNPENVAIETIYGMGEESIPKNIPPEIDRHLASAFGENWRETGITRSQFDYHRDMWKYQKQLKPPVEKEDPQRIKDRTFSNSLLRTIETKINAMENRMPSISYIRDPLDKVVLARLQKMRELVSSATGILLEGKLTKEQRSELTQINKDVGNLKNVISKDVDIYTKRILQEKRINPRTGKVYKEDEARKEAINFIISR